MIYKTKISKKDVFIALCCIVFLLMNIGAIGSSGRRRVKEIVCLSNLQQWGTILETFANDNNGIFPGTFSIGSDWPHFLRDYYKDNKIRLCPAAIIPISEGGQNPFCAWGKFSDGSFGSYGINEYVEGQGYSYPEDYWGNIFEIEDVDNVPLFLDSYWYDVWPHSNDLPPVTDGATTGLAGANEMRRVCINRHNGAVNCLFLDFSARKVGLKELWTLKWHRTYNTEGPWTKAGGAIPQDWPEWMRNFKEF